MIFNEHVKIREEKFGVVIFETLKEKVFTANESGKEIVNLLQQGYSPEEIADSLKDSYIAETSQIKDDVIDFVDQLKDNQIIKT